ncbi:MULTISPECIES: T9SS type A sorting domain-containing protein [Flavobacterium]|uniref:T9SS type A sorting domain-containing protein n=1 Tax=Flavobacterium TaxID=237 RepID=UPI002114F0FC|nr:MULTISPECIES: T9SS type A sorting domain-containing protein [Flavobacterium]UUF13195.1 T9SS type A sorting domain-containing protein [Flavobacterium panici]
MKKIYFLLFALNILTIAKSQTINFPDEKFKAILLSANLTNHLATDEYNNTLIIDANSDGEIQVSEALAIKQLHVKFSEVTNLKGLEYFKNLIFLYCSNNPLLTDLDVSALVNLETLICSDNALANIKLPESSKIKNLACLNNQLTKLDFAALTNIESFYCSGNKFLNLDLTAWSNLKRLYFSKNQLTTLDLKGLKNIEEFQCNFNELQSLDLEELKNLKTLECFYNNLNSLNVKGLDKLESLRCEFNNLTDLDLSGLKNLDFLSAGDNKLTTLDISDSEKVFSIGLDNNLLNSLFLKNGNTDNIYIANNPNLVYVCVDEGESSAIQAKINQYGYKNCSVNSYCSFTPGGVFYTINGTTKWDLNNGSNESFPYLNLKISNGEKTGNFVGYKSGDFSIPAGEGTHTVTPMLENSNYYIISPESVTVTFPDQVSPFTQDFQIKSIGVHNDAEVSILSTIPTRPGFDAVYKIIYKNKGNTKLSGSVILDFNDALLDYVSSVPNFTTQNTNKLVWDYVDLKPFEVREITVTLNVNSPMETPAVNINDRLSFNALITPVTGDEKPVDNSFAMRQIVVGSYDPNDKTCLEGDVIKPELIGEYVHYLIRFENTGTYPAENIVVKDLIDLSKFDISTLVPTSSSHSFVTKISEGNKVEFIFEKINLPFDDAHNDGYISFKIKTLPTLKVGDSFTNEANIYFDYNFPILTNKATSTFKTLETQDFEFSKYFNIYPNPVKDVLNISLQNNIEIKSISIYDVLGQLVVAIPNIENVSNIDVSKLRSGNYILKVKSDKGNSSTKFIKL